MSPVEREWLTEREIKALINQEMRPFHEQNLVKFDALFAAMNQLTGSVRTAAWIIGILLALFGVVFGIKH